MVMRNDSLAWYSYPWPGGSRFYEQHLSDAELVAEIFSHAQAGAARITADGWKFLWTYYGLDGLIALARRGDCFDDASDREVTDQLIRQSMIAGYDPVSGFFGKYSEEANEFELVGM